MSPSSFLKKNLLLLFFFGGCSLPSCTTRPISPQPASAGESFLVIKPHSGDPKVFLDGIYRGELSRWREQTLPVPSGERRLELRLAGYYPYRTDLTLRSGRFYTLRVKMVRNYD